MLFLIYEHQKMNETPKNESITFEWTSESVRRERSRHQKDVCSVFNLFSATSDTVCISRSENGTHLPVDQFVSVPTVPCLQLQTAWTDITKNCTKLSVLRPSFLWGRVPPHKLCKQKQLSAFMFHVVKRSIEGVLPFLKMGGFGCQGKVDRPTGARSLGGWEG